MSEELEWTSKEAYKKVFEYLLSFENKDDSQFEVCDLEQELGNTYKIEFYEQLFDCHLKNAILNRAGCYLSNDESEIEGAVKLIAQHADKYPNVLIDTIDDDVHVYEKCEFQFSCKEFLSAIGFDKKVF